MINHTKGSPGMAGNSGFGVYNESASLITLKYHSLLWLCTTLGVSIFG